MAKRDAVTMTTGMEPLIRKTPGVCGGNACIRRMRLPVWMLVEQREFGSSDDEIIEHWPFLDLADLHAAWEYAELHQAEIAAAIAENDI